MAWPELLLPYDFSPLTVLFFVIVLGLYVTALRLMPKQERPGAFRVFVFMLGLGMCYAVMQTVIDYYASYMFFVHRGQHLILHHLGPFLMALSNPMPIIRFWNARISPGLRAIMAPLGWTYRVLQQPAIAAFLFFGIIYFWLWPSIHFDAMLSRDLYWVMNWSMLLDGMLFWWLIFDPRSPANSTAVRYRWRIFMLVIVALPQMFLGAWIVFNRGMVYDVYEVCGRAWPMPPETDQLIGGVITWVPPAMMSILRRLILMRRAMHEDSKVTTDGAWKPQEVN